MKYSTKTLSALVLYTAVACGTAEEVNQPNFNKTSSSSGLESSVGGNYTVGISSGNGMGGNYSGGFGGSATGENYSGGFGGAGKGGNAVGGLGGNYTGGFGGSSASLAGSSSSSMSSSSGMGDGGDCKDK
ncbi:MAG TPA: hypothetical protein VJA18_03805, partial [Candidatus Nanoarchaeia archaeon]|nr:hypothetical protein [Candidatus Nanoarchaeia archaeon]